MRIRSTDAALGMIREYEIYEINFENATGPVLNSRILLCPAKRKGQRGITKVFTATKLEMRLSPVMKKKLQDFKTAIDFDR